MKIAQLTLDGYFNYGNILQKFALHHTLKKFADFTEVLWASDRKFFPEIGGNPSVQCVLNRERHDFWLLFRLKEAVRQSKFRDFENLYIRTRFDLPYLEDVADEYDYFVVGSDQVWNPEWFSPQIFLEFVPREKKISYAASIGTSSIPDDHKEIFRRGIADFNYLSVREEDAVKIIRELTGRTPIILPDPVLLLKENEWLAVSQKPTWLKEKYQRGFILTYYLRKSPPPEIKTFAAKFNLPTINLLDTENFNHFTTGPAEFIWLFANSTLTFTNSFHGVAFSILFKRPFINLEVVGDNEGVTMSNRIATLLKLFGLEDRSTMLAEPLKIDFTRREEILSLERRRAFKFLLEAFGL